MKIRALRTLHMPSPTFAPTVETIAALPIASGDRSIVAVAPDAIVEIEELEARRLITRRFAEAVK
jgi:hypothetical protein